MKITVTFKNSCQVGPYDYDIYTEVVHFGEKETLKEVHERLTNKRPYENFDGEIHFEIAE